MKIAMPALKSDRPRVFPSPLEMRAARREKTPLAVAVAVVVLVVVLLYTALTSGGGR